MQDILWKNIIEELFPDFARFFLPDLAKKIDFKQGHVFLDKELESLFPESKKGRKHLDKLVKVHLTNRSEKWILIHAEVQSQYDKHFARRMFHYFYRIFDKYQQDIAVIAIFADKTRDWQVSEFNYQFDQTQLFYRFPVFKIQAQEETLLIKSNNPFALVVLAIQYAYQSPRNEDQRLAFKLKLTELLFQKGYPKAKIRAVFRFMHILLKISDELKQEIFIEEAQSMVTKQSKPMDLLTDFEEYFLKKGVQQGIEKGVQQGLEKGVQQGLEKGIHLGVVKFQTRITELLKKRFGKVSKANVQAIQAIQDLDQLDNLLEFALECDSLNSFQQQLKTV